MVPWEPSTSFPSTSTRKQHSCLSGHTRSQIKPCPSAVLTPQFTHYLTQVSDTSALPESRPSHQTPHTGKTPTNSFQERGNSVLFTDFMKKPFFFQLGLRAWSSSHREADVHPCPLRSHISVLQEHSSSDGGSLLTWTRQNSEGLALCPNKISWVVPLE